MSVMRLRALLLTLLPVALILSLFLVETRWLNGIYRSVNLSTAKLSQEPTYIFECRIYNATTQKGHVQNQGQRPKIGKVSMLYGDQDAVYERALETHKAHNRCHGYLMHIQREPMLEGFWTKPAIIQYMILGELSKPKAQQLDWLFWFDADTIILNYNMPLEAFLPPDNDKSSANVSILVAEDWNGLNNGIFAIRVSHYAAELLADVLAFRDFQPDVHLTFVDQSAMDLVLRQPKFAQHAVTVPQRWFNAYPTGVYDSQPKSEVQPGDFLVHFPGVSERSRLMQEWCELSERHDDEWNNGSTQMRTRSEINMFWERWRSPG